MQAQRYEFKYLLDETIALELRGYLASYLPWDEASVGKPDYSYRVNSIYLDSEDLYTFWDWVNSNRNRFKLRMRFYDCGPESPVFLEIKRRLCQCILKQRCAVSRKAIPEVIEGQMPGPEDVVSQDPKHLVALERFVRMTSLLQARPKALVSYLREAYVHPENESLRITFDRQVRIALCPEAEFNLKLRPYVQPFDRQVILEIKFTDTFPAWVNEMVQKYNLTRGAAAKYCEGIANLLHPEHANWLAKPIDAPLVDV